MTSDDLPHQVRPLGSVRYGTDRVRALLYKFLFDHVLCPLHPPLLGTALELGTAGAFETAGDGARGSACRLGARGSACRLVRSRDGRYECWVHSDVAAVNEPAAGCSALDSARPRGSHAAGVRVDLFC
jgi:hypothetical protein